MTDQEVISLVPRPVVPCQCDGEYPGYSTIDIILYCLKGAKVGSPFVLTPH